MNVYDRDRLTKDELVGTFKLRFDKVREKENIPTWQNIYGAPMFINNLESDLMNLFG